MFETYTAAQYRTLDDEAFAVRKQEVKDLLEADALPEGVTDDMLFAEADLIDADEKRRSRANSLRIERNAAVAAGAGTVIASSAKPQEERHSILSGFLHRHPRVPQGAGQQHHDPLRAARRGAGSRPSGARCR